MSRLPLFQVGFRSFCLLAALFAAALLAAAHAGLIPDLAAVHAFGSGVVGLLLAAHVRQAQALLPGGDPPAWRAGR